MLVVCLTALCTTLFHRRDFQFTRSTNYQNHGCENVQVPRKAITNNITDNNLQMQSNSPADCRKWQ